MNINISRIRMSDYEQHHYDKETLKQSATVLGSIEVNPTSDLENVRILINKLSEEGIDSPKLSPDWCFIDCKSADILDSMKCEIDQFKLFLHSLYCREMLPCR